MQEESNKKSKNKILNIIIIYVFIIIPMTISGILFIFDRICHGRFSPHYDNCSFYPLSQSDISINIAIILFATSCIFIFIQNRFFSKLSIEKKEEIKNKLIKSLGL